MAKRTKKELVESLVALRQPADRKLETFSELFAPQMKALESSTRATIKGITDDDRLALGECLANYMLESNNQSNLGLDPMLALSVITAVFGNSTLPLFTSEQALDDKQGIIYFENIVAKSTRGNVTAGQVLAGGARVKDVYPIGYASDAVELANVGSATAANTAINLTFGIQNLKPGYVVVKVGDVKANDDGRGILFGKGIHGKVDYVAGTGVIYLTEAPGSATTVTATVATDFEGSGIQADGSIINNIPRLNIELDSKVVKAHTFALQADTSILSSFISKKRLGIDANKRAVEVLQQQVLREITNDAIARIAAAVNADPLKTTPFNTSPLAGTSIQAHLNSYNLTHSQVQRKMAEYSGKGNFQTMLAGSKFCEFLTGLNEFKQEGTITDDPSYFGTLGGRYGNIKIVRAPQLTETAPQGEAICVYNGNKTDAAAVFCPFMPVVVTNDVPVSDNLLQRRSLIASMATTEVVVDRYLQKVTLEGNPYTPQVVETKEQA